MAKESMSFEIVSPAKGLDRSVYTRAPIIKQPPFSHTHTGSPDLLLHACQCIGNGQVASGARSYSIRSAVHGQRFASVVTSRDGVPIQHSMARATPPIGQYKRSSSRDAGRRAEAMRPRTSPRVISSAHGPKAENQNILIQNGIPKGSLIFGCTSRALWSEQRVSGCG